MGLNPLSVVFDRVGGMCFDSSSLTIHVFRLLQSNHIPDVCGFHPHLCLTHCYFITMWSSLLMSIRKGDGSYPTMLEATTCGSKRASAGVHTFIM